MHTGIDTLRNERVRLDISQDSMANYLGLSRQTLSKYEQRPDLMTIGQAQDYCHCLAEHYERFLMSKVASFSHISMSD